MSQHPTLAELVGLDLSPNAFGDSAVLSIDCQNTYLSGPMKLTGVDEALDEVRRVLQRARDAGRPVIHIAHDAGPGSLYDVAGESGAIAARVAPEGDEPTVVKKFPNSFAQTDLHDRLQTLGIQKLIVVGFMTHMCVSSTVRAGFDLGYQSTIVGKATATRDLPCSDGRVIDAHTLRDASLSGIADLLAGVVETVDGLPG